MALPLLTTVSEVEEVAEYLKTRPEGMTLTEAMLALPRNLFDVRKVEAYTIWGFIARMGDHIKLDALGHDLIGVSPQHRYLVYQKLIYRLKPYRSAVEWMFKRNFKEIMNLEVASYWQTHYRSELGTGDENLMKSMASCFLRVCQAAQFGNLTMGRSGQTSKFEINNAALGRFIIEIAPYLERELMEETRERTMPLPPAAAAPEVRIKPPVRPEPVLPQSGHGPLPEIRIFISPTRNTGMVEQVRTMLDVEKYNYLVAGGTDGLVKTTLESLTPDMHRCNSGIIFITTDDAHETGTGKYDPGPSSLMLIGAAYALFRGNVVLVWDERVAVPDALRGFERCEFAVNELSWNAGVNLMKAVSRFKG